VDAALSRSVAAIAPRDASRGRSHAGFRSVGSDTHSRVCLLSRPLSRSFSRFLYFSLLLSPVANARSTPTAALTARAIEQHCTRRTYTHTTDGHTQTRTTSTRVHRHARARVLLTRRPARGGPSLKIVDRRIERAPVDPPRESHVTGSRRPDRVTMMTTMTRARIGATIVPDRSIGHVRRGRGGSRGSSSDANPSITVLRHATDPRVRSHTE